MTTNSPNSVDGDVQALIEFCESEVKRLQDVINSKNTFATTQLRMKLEIYKNSLASMKAEPVYQLIDDSRWYDAPKYLFDEAKARGDECRVVYTTPPAQLLRPVELPKVKTTRSDWSTWQWIEHLGGRFQNGKPGDYIEFGSVYAVSQMLKQYRRTVTAEVIAEISESLRQQGYEVKS